jgi:hypothetical protein
MKRIVHGSSTSLNEPVFESLKPLYGTKGNPPYYDPNDLHAHVWKKGKLGLEDNPKIPTYAKGKLTIKDCVYCKICHMIKDPFQSTVSNNRDIITDIIIKPTFSQHSDYKIIEGTNNHSGFRLQEIPKKTIYSVDSINEKLFHKQEGIFNNYIKVEKESL